MLQPQQKQWAFVGNCGGGGDIAVVELDRDVPPHVATPICLPDSPDLEVNGQLTAIGWGKIPFAAEKQMEASQYLQEVVMDIKEGYEKRQKLPNDDLVMVERFDRNVCTGDSGGPLMDTKLGINNKLTTVLLGIAHAGTPCPIMYEKFKKGFRDHQADAVWTDVRHYLQWICQETNVGNC